jgi:hypothetical protein
MTIRIYLRLTLLLIPILSGCYPKGPEYVEELDLVYTNYDNQFDFSSRGTYSIPDSVIKITGEIFNDPDGDGEPQFLSAVYATPIINALKDNMAATGWTLVDKKDNPDVVLLVSSMTTTNIYYYYDWSYWDWWYPGYYPYWNWYYPSYYYPAYVTGYRSGSVFVQMVDHKATLQADQVPVRWNCILNGLAEGNTTDIISRIQSNIGKAFAQSPYLRH